jgi:hypothetical protein
MSWESFLMLSLCQASVKVGHELERMWIARIVHQTQYITLIQWMVVLGQSITFSLAAIATRSGGCTITRMIYLASMAMVFMEDIVLSIIWWNAA